jgi:hypothetical protein
METFIAFFDILGFQEIVNNNDLSELKRQFEYLLRDSQTALSSETYIQLNESIVVPDLKNQKVNCLHVSDSIVFWTNSNSEDDFKEIVSVCHSFYWRSLKTTFPLRGCLTYGEIDFNPSTIQNVGGINFYNYSLIGRGLVYAYQKAEAIEYAGCLLDKLAIKRVNDKLINDLINEQKICMYKVPFKTGINYELVFRPINGRHNDVSFRNTVNGIKRLFTFASKADIDKMSESVKNKMNNTIDFLSYFRETDKALRIPINVNQ